MQTQPQPPTEPKTNPAADAAPSTPTDTMNPPAPDPTNGTRPPGAWPFSSGGFKRNGKIARLPREIREELNQRLHKGEQGQNLAKWLNAKKEVKDLLKSEFGGSPITKQNISEWRKGGYREWLLQQEFFSNAGNLTDMAQGLADQLNARDGSRATLGDRLSAHMETRYMALFSTWEGEPTPEVKETLRLYHSCTRDIVLLRRGDHQAIRRDPLLEPSEKQKVALARQWLKDPKIKEALFGRPMSPKEKQRKIKEIFGIAGPDEDEPAAATTDPKKPKAQAEEEGKDEEVLPTEHTEYPEEEGQANQAASSKHQRRTKSKRKGKNQNRKTKGQRRTKAQKPKSKAAARKHQKPSSKHQGNTKTQDPSSKSVQVSPSESNQVQAEEKAKDKEVLPTDHAELTEKETEAASQCSTKSTADTTTGKTAGQGTTNQSDPVQVSPSESE